MSEIKWSSVTEGFPVPTFYCDCGQVTEGFSVCLKCNPQTYEVAKVKPKYLQDIESKIDQITKLTDEIAEQIYKAAYNEAIEDAANSFEGSPEMKPAADQVRRLKK